MRSHAAAAAAASTPPPHESPSVLAKRSSQTRKAIKKFYPGQSTGKDMTNPITLHSVNDDLFPRLWSFLAETMIAPGELSSATKEAIAFRVTSSKNALVRRIPPSSDKGANHDRDPEAELRKQALEYSEALLAATDNACASSPLNKTARAETALVVLLFQHLSRSMTAVLGEQRKSSALMSVSFRSKERSSDSHGVKGVVQRMISPMMSNSTKAKPGMTSPLFASFANGSFSSLSMDALPAHLQEASHVGEDCASALARLVDWVECYETQLLTEDVLTEEVLQLLQDAVPPAHLKSHQMAQWVSVDLRPTLNALQGDGDLHQDIARVFLMVQHSPESVANCSGWKGLNKALGKDKAITLVLWWSLRITLEQARGLRA